jgi:cellulose synthase/poly-beta-1,6-N-acetylglucosamine synthase-like glycosyltransferase
MKRALYRVADVCVAVASAPALGAAAYLGALAAFARAPRESHAANTLPFFDVVIPAHDEARHVAETIASVRAIDYPSDRFRIVVVADNCRDATASRARAAGAEVLERRDKRHRGKGHALAFAFADSLARGRADAIAVIDADTEVSPNLLRAFAARLSAGERALQADYGVRNPDASWRTRLMVVALASFHGVRSSARERLGLSCGLRGNGMAFARDVLREVPYGAFSIVEDVEYGIKLGEAGVRVAYVDDARVLGDMAPSGDGARTQRNRWESGRRELAREHALHLIRRGVLERNPVLLDLGMDLIVPPLATLAAWTALGVASAGAVAYFARRAGVPVFAWIPWTLAAAGIAAYVARGVSMSGAGVRGFSAVARAPAFMAWKAFVPRAHKHAWIRTARDP